MMPRALKSMSNTLPNQSHHCNIGSLKSDYIITLMPTLQEHWYKVERITPGGLVLLGYFPSSTTILNAYPQSLHLTKWIAEQGWNESQERKSEAGRRGTNVHGGAELLLKREVLLRDMYDLEEWVKIWAFTEWFKINKIYSHEVEFPLFNPVFGYAGKADR